MSSLTERAVRPDGTRINALREDIKSTAHEARTYTDDAFGDDGFPNVTVDELEFLGNRLLDCRSIVAAYDIMAEPSKSGICNYDVIVGPQHTRSYNVLGTVLNKFEKDRYVHTLDIGTGTGSTARILSTISNNVVAVDLSPSMLSVAAKRMQKWQELDPFLKFNVCVMDATHPGFRPNSFDVIIDNAIRAYLTKDEEKAHLKNVWEMLVVGGRYYRYMARELTTPKVYETSPRAKLAGYVASALFSFSFLAQRLDMEGTMSQFDPGQYGFTGGAIPIQGEEYPEVVWRLTKE